MIFMNYRAVDRVAQDDGEARWEKVRAGNLRSEFEDEHQKRRQIAMP
jgi:hypothetical protein